MNRNHLRVHLLIVIAVATCVLLVWFFRILDFFHPQWLWALLALPIFSYVSTRSVAGLPSRTSMFAATFRSLLYILVVVALADIQFVKKSNDLGVYFLMDYSASIPEAVREQELKYINSAVETKKKDDLAGVIVFAEEPSIEVTPDRELEVSSLHSAVNPNYTNLQSAVELAVAAFPSGVRRKIVLISDGNQNAGDVMKAVRYANSEQVEIDVLPVAYAAGKEVLMKKLHIPPEVRQNETFDIKVHVESHQPCPATLTILRNDVPIVKQGVNLVKGDNSFELPVKLDSAGFFTYQAIISAPQYDTIRENNEASSYIHIQGNARVLFVTPGGRTEEIEHLVSICNEEKLEPVINSPEQFPTRFEELSSYDCVVLANVGAGNFTTDQMKMVKSAVRDMGIGLIMIGGEDSFGAGGYEQTPIEDALPVSMDIRQKKIMPKGALVLVLHTCEFDQGNYWAKQISKAAIKTLQPQDDVGILFYGMKGSVEWLFKLRPANNRPYLFNKIDKCEPGDMPSFVPAFAKAQKALRQTDAMVRHMIIISDGDPARPNRSDVKKLIKAGITVSCVAINPHSPRDVGVMKAIAFETKGRYYLVDNPKNLPKIFVKEARVVKRSLIFNKTFQPMLTVTSELTKGLHQPDIPKLHAYVATTEKDRALISMRADNENKDPILAEWRYGLGKAVAFTSDASSNWGKDWVKWAQYKKIWSQIIRWTARKREKADLSIRSRLDGNKVVMTVDAIDAKGNFVNFNKLDGRRVDSKHEGHRLEFQQTAPGRYQATFDSRSSGVNMISLSYLDPTGKQGFVQAGVSLPYSAEFLKLGTDFPLLRKVNKAGGGSADLLPANPKIAEIFKSSLPPSVTLSPIWQYLLVVAVGLFMVDVFVRRVIFSWGEVQAGAHNFIKRKKEEPEKDEVIGALLQRKEKVFSKDKGEERTKGKAAERNGESFRERLVRESQGAERIDVVASSAAEGKATTADSSETPRPASGKPPKPPELPSSESSEGGYTSRLLDAKRRARKKKED